MCIRDSSRDASHSYRVCVCANKQLGYRTTLEDMACTLQLRLMILTRCSCAVSAIRPSVSFIMEIRHSEPVVGPRYQTCHCCTVYPTSCCSITTAWCACTVYSIMPCSGGPPGTRPRDKNWRRRPIRQHTWTAWLDCLQTTTNDRHICAIGIGLSCVTDLVVTACTLSHTKL